MNPFKRIALVLATVLLLAPGYALAGDTAGAAAQQGVHRYQVVVDGMT